MSAFSVVQAEGNSVNSHETDCGTENCTKNEAIGLRALKKWKARRESKLSAIEE